MSPSDHPSLSLGPRARSVRAVAGQSRAVRRERGGPRRQSARNLPVHQAVGQPRISPCSAGRRRHPSRSVTKPLPLWVPRWRFMRTASVNSSCNGSANLRTGRKVVPARSAYTPEPVTPSELALSRQACGVACDAQPVIKGTLPNRDIAHMAATSLGYLTWGVTNDPMDYGLGDLGGWALDLLQIWGSYLANTPKEDLASWLHAHLGEQDARMGFSYSDVLADCDAWLLARSMQSNSSERSLSTAMRDMFAQSETNRIKRFYQSRFKGSADNLVIAFRKLVDGIDLGIFDNVSGSKKALLIASHADRLPSQAEAGILALSYAESLENPNR